MSVPRPSLSIPFERVFNARHDGLLAFLVSLDAGEERENTLIRGEPVIHRGRSAHSNHAPPSRMPRLVPVSVASGASWAVYCVENLNFAPRFHGGASCALEFV